MPRAVFNKSYFTYVGGLITEASPLTFPENASFDEDNFDLFRDGSRKPRRGADFEASNNESGNVAAAQFEERYHNWFLWRAVNDEGDNNIHIFQQGDTLLAVDADSHPLPTTSATIGTPTASPAATNVGDSRIEFAAGAGFLFGAGPSVEPFFVEETTPGTFTLTDITLTFRDFEGVDDTQAIDARVTPLTDLHDYNLQNQGWTVAAYTTYNGSTGVFPSNADIVFEGKDATGVFTAAELDLQFFGNSRAPRGHFILDFFNQDRDAVAGTTTIPDVIISERPNSVAFFSGRPWWGGPGNNLFFSQIIEDTINIGLCYQEADPTSEHISDLIATDGGKLTIAEADEIIAIRPLGTALVVLAKNGVWAVNGGDRGFRADEFFIRKISNQGALGAGPSVEAEGIVFYWAAGGIYAIAENETTGLLQAQNITDQTIASFYINNIGNEDAKETASGVYDNVQRKVFWFYNSDVTFDKTTDAVNNYDRVLVFDIVLSAFSPYTFATLDNQDPQVVSPMLRLNSDVLAGNRQKLMFKTAWVVATSAGSPTQYHFAYNEFSNNEIKDWEGLNNIGKAYTAFIETGFEILEDAMRDKEATHLFMFFKRTETAVLTAPAVTELVTNGTFDDCTQAGPIADWTDTSSGALNQFACTSTQLGQATLERGGASGFAGGQQLVTTSLGTPAHTITFSVSPFSDEPVQLRIGSTSGADDILAAATYAAGTNQVVAFTPGFVNSSFFVEFRNNGPGNFVFIDNVSIFDPSGDTSVILFDFPSGCFAQGRWDWSDDAISGKEGQTFQAYKFERLPALAQGETLNIGTDVIVSKNTIRGHGKALQLRFENEPNKDCHILGWAISFSGETVP